MGCLYRMEKEGARLSHDRVVLQSCECVPVYFELNLDATFEFLICRKTKQMHE